jgi:hypothetical protein
MSESLKNNPTRNRKKTSNGSPRGKLPAARASAMPPYSRDAEDPYRKAMPRRRKAEEKAPSRKYLREDSTEFSCWRRKPEST